MNKIHHHRSLTLTHTADVVTRALNAERTVTVTVTERTVLTVLTDYQ